MSAAHQAFAASPLPGRDFASWQDQIDLAIATPDPTLANLRITVAHYDLSLALHEVLGPDTGANFHTWATWGSKKAGQTIRREEAPWLDALAALIGGGLGLLGAAIAPRRAMARHPLARIGGALLGAWGLHALTQRRRDDASRQILGGNVTVLDDIGRQTARFVSMFADCPGPDPQRLADFLAFLRPGPAEAGGQDLLTRAFTHYYQARHAAARAARYEHMLLGNLHAILHEHIRLQPYIAGAMPRPARRLITRHLLTFALGRRTMRVSEDVAPLAGAMRPSLAPNDELRAFLETWGRAGDGMRGSRAKKWADIHDRMAYICALFRTGHADDGLFTTPYTVGQCAEIAAGRMPSGAL